MSPPGTWCLKPAISSFYFGPLLRVFGRHWYFGIWLLNGILRGNPHIGISPQTPLRAISSLQGTNPETMSCGSTLPIPRASSLGSRSLWSERLPARRSCSCYTLWLTLQRTSQVCPLPPHRSRAAATPSRDEMNLASRDPHPYGRPRPCTPFVGGASLFPVPASSCGACCAGLRSFVLRTIPSGPRACSAPCGRTLSGPRPQVLRPSVSFRCTLRSAHGYGALPPLRVNHPQGAIPSSLPVGSPYAPLLRVNHPQGAIPSSGASEAPWRAPRALRSPRDLRTCVVSYSLKPLRYLVDSKRVSCRLQVVSSCPRSVHSIWSLQRDAPSLHPFG